MAATPLPVKMNYRCAPSLHQFYSGGALAVSADGSFVACAFGESINVVETSNSSIRATMEGDSESVTALTLSPDDKFLFSASHSRQIRVWDLETFTCVRSWKGHDGPVMGMACHPSGGFLATAGADKKVIVWDVAGSFATHYFTGHKGVVSSVLFHPDPSKQLLFSASHDATVHVWDLSTKKRVKALSGHNSTVTSMALSEDGWTLLTAGRDKVVMLWDLHNYSCLKTVTTYEVLETVCVIPSGTLLASCVDSLKQQSGKKSKLPSIDFITVGDRGIVRIWNSEGAVCLFEQKSSDITVTKDADDESSRGFTAAFMLPLDQGLICVTADQEFLLYSTEERPEGTFDFVLSKRLVGNNGDILDMKFLGDEEQFIAVATNTEQVRVFDVATMSCYYVLAGHTEIVMCLDTCVSSCGRTLIVTGSKDNTVRLWDSESRSCVGVGLGHMGSIGAVAFSKKSRNFFVSGSSDRNLKKWSLDGLSDNVEKPISLKAKAGVSAHDKDINTVVVAPNDRFFCSGSQDHTASVWNEDLVLVHKLRGHKRGVWSVEFSPVEKCVLTASGDKTIKIWALSDGSCLKTFEGHMSSVYRASYLTHGTQLISSDANGSVKLWMVKANECIATYDEHDDKVYAVAVGKKTEMIATGSSDAAINLWYDCTASDKEEAFRKEEEAALKIQELENAVKDADYTKAIQIAFKLRRPHKLYQCFDELCRLRGTEKQIDKSLQSLDKEELWVLFEYLRDWNTKAKFFKVAQRVLFRLLNIINPTEIMEIKGIDKVLEAFIPYSKRHHSRIDGLVRSTLLLDYLLHSMSVVEPDTGAREMMEQPLMPPVVNHESETSRMETEDQEQHLMSVVEPDTGARELMEQPLMPSMVNHESETSRMEIEDREQNQTSEDLKDKSASKKRKSKKSKERDGSKKKKAKESSL